MDRKEDDGFVEWDEHLAKACWETTDEGIRMRDIFRRGILKMYFSNKLWVDCYALCLCVSQPVSTLHSFFTSMMREQQQEKENTSVQPGEL